MLDSIEGECVRISTNFCLNCNSTFFTMALKYDGGWNFYKQGDCQCVNHTTEILADDWEVRE